MRYIIPVLVALIVVVVNPQSSYSQGCSDGGACSLMMGSDEHQVSVDNEFSAGLNFGLGDDDVTITTPFIKFSRKLSDNIDASARLTYGIANGDLGTISNFGDLLVSLSHSFELIEDVKSSITIGGKIPLNNSAEEIDGIISPMVYQPSVGSYDLILGLGSEINSFSFWLGVQHPVAYSNENNRFLTFDEDSNLIQTAKLKRTGDIILRFSYHYELIEDVLSITPAILPIYHHSNDSYETENGKDIEIADSKGFTLNGAVTFNYSIDKDQQLVLSVARPFVYREVFPAGLKRSLVAGLEYKVRF